MKRALLVIDVQNEYFDGKLPISYPEPRISLNNIKLAMQAAHTNKLPIIIIQHSAPAESPLFAVGSHNWKIHPEIEALPHNTVIEKKLPGSFAGTSLSEVLSQNNIDTLVICGYMTQMCCDTTARQAFHMGLNVEFLSDATGTLDITNSAGSIAAADLHKAILVTQAMRFSTVMTTAEWLEQLVSTAD